ncbi:MAG: SH3 domain-containing protein [Lachnospiraceae bacterium]|nr:SH3 domain-containing protein [Lachnospiraceae bacterium]
MFQKAWNVIKGHYFVSSCIIFVVICGIIALVAVLALKQDAGESGEGEEVVAVQDRERDLSLKTNAYDFINSAMTDYYTALANNDQDKIKEYVEYISDNELFNIAVKSNYIESYENITCYTQDGFAPNSYYVYVSYDIKMVNYETTLPGLVGLYYAPNGAGKYYIYRRDDMDQELVSDFYDAYSVQEVKDLFTQVSDEYNVAIASDPALAEFMGGFETLVKDEMAKLIAIEEAGEAAEGNTEVVTTDGDGNETTEPVNAGPEIVKATTKVNVRASDSENAEKIGSVIEGAELTRLETKVNGWSKIIYNGQEGYIKSDYLVPVGGDDTQATDPDKTYVTVSENVNVRKEASMDAERVVLAQAGDKFELVEKLSNGWTKVKYNGQDAFIKSEYVQ